ncbi:STE/STE20 protein kinase [Cladophialophora psammophila CBS 110553]|uniref:STE/STE20 protein kinase n=1 Tax=Cladophialophora psammophila CBS 110553 TaxID=1182543 RepID=W9VKI0_9EURO|nr:STE/STE20 protein kinase [Cladophialophora psammophila CBS 110553]EXJ53530.1 STE/STE20 protein kinase [Cladophialophora psammophila CBS 110553]
MGIRPSHAEHNPLRQFDSEPHHHHSKHSLRFGMWQKIQHFFAKDDATHSPIECSDYEQWPQTWADRQNSAKQDPSTRPLAVGLPRQATFRRQNSERRDRLLPIEPCHAERRAVSSTRHTSISLPRRRATSSPPNWDSARTSAPAVTGASRAAAGTGDAHIQPIPPPSLDSTHPDATEDIWSQDDYRPPRPPSRTSSDDSHYPQMPIADDKVELRDELDHRWILNLSMHFRDKSDREKFFVTYAQTPTFWRRVTISCDYRNAEPGSLEMDLKELQFQRDKSMQIYESIRDSLPEIQFYDTVTNLKLETTDGRLHVHVTEDVNEIIPYPPKTTLSHILNDVAFRPMQIRESELAFDSHLSGFVYKVLHKGTVYIKKEIPGPDTVDEFLYEINALHALHDSDHVIKLEAIVLDDTESVVKGLLIGYAERGAIVDLLYDHRGAIAWEDRSRWAEQAVRGLSEIHEEGYVQGDFTLSNIVVDGEGNAKIIDINRRGCPVGWEPPEIATKIASNQRISMYIGEKSDIYQLGMTLWALAMDDDEPERHVPPLSVEEFPSDVPKWYQDIVRICLSPRPRDRLSAKELVDLFPSRIPSSSEKIPPHQRPALKLRTMKKYIDPADAVERDDILRLSSNIQEYEAPPYSPESSRDDYTFTYPKSSNYEFESETSGYDRPRGRRPPTNYAHLGKNERHHWESEDERPTPTEDLEPNIVAISPGMDREFDELELDGHPYLVSRRTFNDEELKILEGPALGESDFEEQAHPQEKGAAEATEAIGLADIFHPLPVRRPSLLATTSATSESTPRNSQDLLAALAQYRPEKSGCLESPTAKLEHAPRNSEDTIEDLGNTIEENPNNAPKLGDMTEKPENKTVYPEDVTEYLQNPTGNLEMAPNDLADSTEHLETLTDLVKSTGNIQKVPEQVDNAPENIANAPENIQKTPEQVGNVPGNPKDSTENIQKASEHTKETSRSAHEPMSIAPKKPGNTTEAIQRKPEPMNNPLQNLDNTTETTQKMLEKVEDAPENVESTIENFESATDFLSQNSDYMTPDKESDALRVKDSSNSVTPADGNTIPQKITDQSPRTATMKPPSLPFMDSGYSEPLDALGNDICFSLMSRATEKQQLLPRWDKIPEIEDSLRAANDPRLANETLDLGQNHEAALLFADIGNGDCTMSETAPPASLRDTAGKDRANTLPLWNEPLAEAELGDMAQIARPNEQQHVG